LQIAGAVLLRNHPSTHTQEAARNNPQTNKPTNKPNNTETNKQANLASKPRKQNNIEVIF
jgi:hypothetical protein